MKYLDVMSLGVSALIIAAIAVVGSIAAYFFDISFNPANVLWILVPIAVLKSIKWNRE